MRIRLPHGVYSLGSHTATAQYCPSHLQAYKRARNLAPACVFSIEFIEGSPSRGSRGQHFISRGRRQQGPRGRPSFEGTPTLSRYTRSTQSVVASPHSQNGRINPTAHALNTCIWNTKRTADRAGSSRNIGAALNQIYVRSGRHANK